MDSEASDRIILKKATSAVLLKELEQAGIALDENKLNEFLSLVEMVAADDEAIKAWAEFPQTSLDVMAFMVPKTYYHVNARRASLYLAAKLIDAPLPVGLASLALNMMHGTGKAIAKLKPETGEYCALVHAVQLQKRGADISPVTVAAITSGNECPFANVGCKFMSGKTCSADYEDFAGVFHALQDKGALEDVDGVWRVPL
jgi:hypothetical protein